MDKLVSVIVPCFNHEDYVEDCLRSIIAQTYKNIELIVCDDCSPDSSYEIIQEMRETLEQRFANVILYRNERNYGVTKTLNSMIENASGDYIKEIASDDMLVEDSIEKLVRFMESEKCDIAFSDAWLIDDNQHFPVTLKQGAKTIYSKKPYSGTELTGEICAHDFIFSPGAIYPRATIEKYGLYDESLIVEDYEYMLRVSVDGNIKYLDEKTVYYRVLDNSLSHFDGSYKSIARFRKVNESRQVVFDRYSSYCNEQQMARFYNDSMALAIKMNDRTTVEDVKMKMKSLGLNPSLSNGIKLVMYYTGMYEILKHKG